MLFPLQWGHPQLLPLWQQKRFMPPWLDFMLPLLMDDDRRALDERQ